MADTSFRVLSSPYPKQRKPRSPETNRTIWILLPSRRSLLGPPQCLVHAAHEILIFLYFQSAVSFPAPTPLAPLVAEVIHAIIGVSLLNAPGQTDPFEVALQAIRAVPRLPSPARPLKPAPFHENPNGKIHVELPDI
jgi:hypothetical protein